MTANELLRVHIIVLSELIRPTLTAAISSRIAKRATSSLHLTTVSEPELRFGLAIMPPGRRRDGLAEGLERMLRTGFANRVLPFNSAAAAYAKKAAARRVMGRPMPEADRGHRPLARHGDSDTQRARFRGCGHRRYRPLDGRMTCYPAGDGASGVAAIAPVAYIDKWREAKSRESATAQKPLSTCTECSSSRHRRGLDRATFAAVRRL